MKNIPPLDLTRQYATIESEVSAVVFEILKSGRYIGGANVTEFEQKFADYIGASECVSCNSGTDALYLALQALGIGEGDEVITTPFTFIATSEVIANAGATPVFVDIDPVTFNLNINQIEAALTNKTKAIIPVHLFGQPLDMGQLMAVAEAHNLVVIEDCAQATGAEWEEQKVGSIGHVGCFSFFPTKNLGGCGDGGAITTNNPQLAADLKMLKEHGSKIRYYHEVNGINSRLDALQAAILKIKLRYLDTWNQKRRQVAQHYNDLLKDVPGIKPPQQLPGGKAVCNQYTIRVVGEQPSQDSLIRDHLRQSLQEQGIISMIYYPIPLHLQPVYQHLGYEAGQFPEAEQAAREVLSLPMFPELTLEEQKQVVDSLKISIHK